MSYDTGWGAINLTPHDRPAHTVYSSHLPLMSKVTGLPEDAPELRRRFQEAWDVDFIFGTNDGAVPWQDRGRTTDMGHAEFMADGSDRRETISCPFNSVEDVLAFDAVTEYGLPDFDELVAYYETWHAETQANEPYAVRPGGYYKTIVSGLIQAFGWDLLLEAAAYPKEFTRVLDSVFELSLHHYKAWAKTAIKVFLCHDDMVWTMGAFMRPDFYREVIFPRYARLWSVLKAAGKKVLFCSDGTWTEFMDDIVAAGADGLIFEPTTSFEYAVEKYGQSHLIMASTIDCRTLTFGTRDQIKAEIDESLRLGLPCPGWVCAVGNHIAPNVPIDNAMFYIDYLRENWGR